jgi:TonB family protein
LRTQLLNLIRRTWRASSRPLLLCALLALVQSMAVAPPRLAAQSGERKLVKQVEPEYPLILKRAGIGGSVRLKVYVKANGEVKDSDVLGGNPTLAEYAQRAVKQWRFSPADSPSTIEIKLTFDPKR